MDTGISCTCMLLVGNQNVQQPIRNQVQTQVGATPTHDPYQIHEDEKLEDEFDTDLAQQFQSSHFFGEEPPADDQNMEELLKHVASLGSEEPFDPYLIPENPCASPPPRGTCASPLGDAGKKNQAFCKHLCNAFSGRVLQQ